MSNSCNQSIEADAAKAGSDLRSFRAAPDRHEGGAARLAPRCLNDEALPWVPPDRLEAPALEALRKAPRRALSAQEPLLGARRKRVTAMEAAAAQQELRAMTGTSLPASSLQKQRESVQGAAEVSARAQDRCWAQLLWR